MEAENKLRLKDRFSRWQSKTNEQFGFFNNLLLVLSVGTVGFIINLLIKTEFSISHCWAKCFFGLSIMSLIVSILFGTYLGYNRLKDFRKTAAKILARIKAEEDELEILIRQTDYLGKLSWILIKIQFISFLLGELLIVFSLGLIFGNKLL